MKSAVHYFYTPLLFALLLTPLGSHAQNDDIIDLIPFGALSEGLIAEKVETCKTDAFKDLVCGDGMSSYIDNFYVIFIDFGLQPADLPLEIAVHPLPGKNDPIEPLNKKHCGAQDIEVTVIDFVDLPIFMQTDLEVPPGKIAVYHRVRVHWGAQGKRAIHYRQLCLKE